MRLSGWSTKTISGKLAVFYHKVQKGHFEEVLDYCREHSATLKRRVRVHNPSGDVEGQATNIDSDGSLLIRQDSGKIIKTTAGDVRII